MLGHHVCIDHEQVLWDLERVFFSLSLHRCAFLLVLVLMWRRMTTPFVIVVVGAAARSLAIISSELKTWTRSLNSLGSGKRWCWQQWSRGGQQRQRRRTKINTTPAQIQPGKSASSIETKMMMIKEDTNSELYMIFSRLKSMMLKKCLKSSHKSATYATYQGGCVTVTEFCCDFLEMWLHAIFCAMGLKICQNVSSEFSRRK